MKNRDVWKKLENLVLGKGFYIALALCVAVIGVSGWYLSDLVRLPEVPPAPAAGSAQVEIPEPKPELPVPKPVPKPQPQPNQIKPQPRLKKAEPKKQEPVVYTWPVDGAVIREFNVEALVPDPTMGDWRTHQGMDVAAPEGSSVLAIGRGRVKETYEDPMMGTSVVLEHDDGVISVYCGLAKELKVKAGDKVEAGTVIGTVGNTAIAESGMESHVHLETWREGGPTDPTYYLPIR